MQVHAFEIKVGQKFRMVRDSAVYTALKAPTGEFNTYIEVERNGEPVGEILIYSSQKVEIIEEYPVGTKISEIKEFDRSTKVWFSCPNHATTWASKDPWASSWFRMKGMGDQCNCPVGDFETTHPYVKK